MGIYDDQDTSPLDLILEIARTLPDAAMRRKEQSRSTMEDSPLKSFGIGVGADLLNAFVPESGGDVLFDMVTELGGGPAMAFIPPNLLSKIGDIPLKLPKNVSKVSPEVAEKTESLGMSWLEELLEKSAKEPKKSLHGTGDTFFTGDEIDLSRGATGAGGDFMGRVFYSTNDPEIAEGYIKSALMKAVTEGDKSITKYWEEAGDILSKKYGDDFVGSKPKMSEYDGRLDEFQDDLQKYMEQGNERSKLAFELGVEGEDFGHMLELVTQPGAGIQRYEEAFGPGFRQALSQGDAASEVVATIKEVIGPGTADIIEKRIKGATSAQDMTEGIRDILNERDILALDPEMRSNAAADITNRVMRELGIDQIDYPSGMNFTDFQGSRNYATLNPEVLGETPLDEVIMGNEAVDFDHFADLMTPNLDEGVEAALDQTQQYWDEVIDELVGDFDRALGEVPLDDVLPEVDDLIEQGYSLEEIIELGLAGR